jgi:DNA polymerase-3 subunit epsilon
LTLDTEKEHIIEVGAVLWDTERQAPLAVVSDFVNPGISVLEHKITELTGITLDDLERYGNLFGSVEAKLFELFSRADAVLAHNGNLFDKPMLASNSKRFGSYDFSKFLWADSTCDIEFPPEIQTRKLTYLAAEHGFLNPFAHRAIFDVLTMLKVASRYDWKQIISYAKTPTITIEANTTYEQRELAKKLNYRWNGDKKKWTKSIKEFQLGAEKEAATKAGFSIKQAKG